jgi:hypothetical protein
VTTWPRLPDSGLFSEHAPPGWEDPKGHREEPGSGRRGCRRCRRLLLACGVGVGIGFALRLDLAVGWAWSWTTTHTLRYAFPLVLVGPVASAGQLTQASSDAIASEACRDSPEPRCFEAAGQGFEPQLPGPEPGVLPLDDPATAGAVYRVGYEAFPSPISSR